ncbi:MAG: M56 family metallopeptidase [Acidobacteriota bacterium]|nr:M56 family metallopeptidase [Acidobacteriota bacterium]
MTLSLWNLAAYSAQVAVLAVTAAAAAFLFRLDTPRVAVRYWQAVLAACFALPLLQTWTSEPGKVVQASIHFISTSTANATSGSRPIDPAEVILAVVAAGIVLRLAWLGVGLRRLRSVARRAEPAASLAALSAQLQADLGARAELLLSDDVEGPATVGVRRAVILVPRRIVELPQAVQRAVLCHELMHVRRRDWLVTVAEEVWCAFLWFHPGVRLIASRACLARETLVDEAVITHTRDRRGYAEALLAFSNSQPQLIGATALIGRRQLSQRISLIAQEVAMSRSRIASLLALSAAIVAAATLSAASSVPMVGALQAPEVQVHQPGSGVTLPVVVKEVKPVYPRDVLPEKVQGSVWMRCVVLAGGTVGDIEVTRSLHPRLDREAVQAATQWEFKPGTKDGKPVAVEITLEMTFTLK